MAITNSEMLNFYQSQVKTASIRNEDAWKEYRKFVDDAHDVQALEGSIQANTLREAWQEAKKKHEELVTKLFNMLDELSLME